MVKISVAIVISLLALSACSEQSKAPQESIRPIAWTEVKAHALTQTRRLAGTTAAVEKASLSFLVGGKVSTVLVKLGQSFKLGDVLATLDQRSFTLNYQSALAKLEQARSALNETQNEYQRYKELVAKGLVSQSGFDNAEAPYRSARSNVDVAQSQVDLAQKDRQDSTLRAPYDGVITKRMIEPSQQIPPGQSVFEIEGKGGLEVHVLVPESLIQQLTHGMSVPVHFPAAPEVNLTGVISEVGTRAETANAFPITLLLYGSPPELRAGMTAEVDITYAGTPIDTNQETVIVPLSALGAGQKQSKFVFVYHPDSQSVHKREVVPDNIRGNLVYISDGLSEGDIIAVAGVAFLRDGQRVTLLDTNIQRFN
ncbi:MAG: multidrug efflux system membrane fusion protein [Paraglaciecola sp.]